MEEKCIVATWLFKTDLSNLNAGEGSTNLKELKTYKSGLPYISGQSVRHALREAIRREYPDNFRCTVEFPCGNLKDCWLCDMFGYLLPSEGAKRWSPVKASPALGQIKSPVATDMILRLVNDIECPLCNEKINPLVKGVREEGKKEIKKGAKLKCPKCGKVFEAPYDIRQAIAYKQLIENIYRVSVSIDISALGVEEVPIIEGKGTNAKIIGIKYNDLYGNNSESERKGRIRAILGAISNISDFASQSRELTNATPDVILLSIQKQYNHRLSSALQMDEKGCVNPQMFKETVEDCLAMPGTKIYAGFISGIINNEEDMIPILNDAELKTKGLVLCNTPREAILEVIKLFNGETINENAKN
ncbi:CRISPR-associated protein Cst2 [Methanophagales archaeon]|nr:CRISPR-associated protein Cst2 [Methanophagales archaeon]